MGRVGGVGLARLDVCGAVQTPNSAVGIPFDASQVKPSQQIERF